MSAFFEDKRIIVTGGAGFLGGALVEKLRQRGCVNIFIPRRRDYDLRDRENIQRLLRNFPCDIVIHLAASVGGIGANRANPGSFFYDNAIMGIDLIEQCRRFAIGKLVLLGTVCAYPKFCAVPFRESDLWNGYPEETNAPYGLAKKMLLAQSQAYRKQYGFNSIFLVPINLYGPGDNFDSRSSHVIPALIRKCVEALKSGERRIVCWGDGSPTREFLYVEDCAEAIVLATERYDESDPVNIGVGFEISIRQLVEKIAGQVGFRGEIIWDRCQPNGQPRRRLDTTRAERKFGFKARISLDEGLRRTIEWYTVSMGVRTAGAN